MLPRPPPVAMSNSTEAVAAAAEQHPGHNTIVAQHATSTALLSPLSEGDGHTLQPPEDGYNTFRPQNGDDTVTGTHVTGGSPYAMGMAGALAVEAVGDVNAALGPDSDLSFVFDGELGDGSMDIHDNVENTFVENNLDEEDLVDRPAIESGEGACRCVPPVSSSSL